jgi:hypothetical protein
MMPRAHAKLWRVPSSGIVSGLVFGGPAGVALTQWMGVGQLLSPAETVLMGSAAASHDRLVGAGRAHPHRRPHRARPDALTAIERNE